jgi:HPt (histidine-containing phosphotransfer) domain-containing protein
MKQRPAEENGQKKLPTGARLTHGIEGLDVSKGMALTGGTYDKYMKMLEVFHEDGLEKIGEIKNCLEAEDLRLFTIYIHAIKNACSVSGAEDLSRAASALELAGIRNDSDFIRENVSAFLSDFETLLGEINNALNA